MERNDFINWSDERLEQEADHLRKHKEAPYLSETRKKQIVDRLCYVAFEQLQRMDTLNHLSDEIDGIEFDDCPTISFEAIKEAEPDDQ